MRIFIDYDKKKIAKVEAEKELYFGNNAVDKVTVLVDHNPADTFYALLSAKCSNGRDVMPRLSDALLVGESNIEVIDEKTYYKFTFTLSYDNGWALSEGLTNFFVWFVYVDKQANECVGGVRCNILGTTGYYQIDNPVINGKIKESIDKSFAIMKGELQDEIKEETTYQRDLINNFVGGQPRYINTRSNILALTTNKGIAVSTDNNGHWYYWDGTQYVDSGLVYTNTVLDNSVLVYDRNIGGSATIAAPYDNFNTMPVNRIVSFTIDISSISNYPINEQGVLYTTGNTQGTILKQTFITRTNVKYERMKWGSWTAWEKVTGTITNSNVDNTIMAFDKNIGSSSTIIAPYNDFNTMPQNRIVTFTTAVGSIANCPKNEQGILYTYGYDTYIVKQIFITRYNEQYERLKWSGAWTSWIQTNASSSQDSQNASISLFRKIGVVGDSYASGEIYYAGVKQGDFYDLSWLQIMARNCGFIATNYSKGGLTTKTWLTDSYGLSLLESSESENLYILALGLNDRNIGLSYLGVESDMETLNDTFYGNYARIINAIKTKSPNAKLIISTMAVNNSSTEIAYNLAIVNIANHYGIPVIYQYNDEYFQSTYYLDRMQGSHPTAVNYSGMAVAIERLIEKAMVDNPSYFLNYKG